MAEDKRPLPPIEKSYLLVSGINCYCDLEGYRYFDLLWHKDLLEHLRYIKNFTLASPCIYENPPSDFNGVKFDQTDLEFFKVEFIDLPVSSNSLEAIIYLPKTTSVLWRAIQQADIVHAGIVGFPFPLAWLVTPVVYYWKKFYIIIVESAPWRFYSGSPASFKGRLKAHISEFMGRWCLKQANLSIFTQEEYLNSFLTHNNQKGYVIPASWIDEDIILSNEVANEIWNEKIKHSQPLKIVFAGRLTASKGIPTLLESLVLLDNKNVQIQIDILGQGELLSECEKLKGILKNSVQINLLGSIAYGSPFFEVMQQYHAVVVPNCSDEQPRIVFDAYSQAVPVVASDTPGLRSCIHPQKTGVLVKPNDAEALAEVLSALPQSLGQLKEMGIEALNVARQMSHRTMHQKRWQLLVDFLEKSNP
jgi:glycosyltransferase involved in cell wall biosynthesis